MHTYVAFLRGINVGKKQVKMELLRSMMEKEGYTHVKTLLASGNVVFDTAEGDAKVLRKNLEELYKKIFGFEIPVILQTAEEIQSLIKKDPFKGVSMTKDTRLYVTFRSREEAHKKESSLTVPASAENNFRILSVTDNEICSVLHLTLDGGTLKLMDSIEKAYGKYLTTRNWNTVQKIAALL